MPKESGVLHWRSGFQQSPAWLCLGGGKYGLSRMGTRYEVFCFKQRAERKRLRAAVPFGGTVTVNQYFWGAWFERDSCLNTWSTQKKQKEGPPGGTMPGCQDSTSVFVSHRRRKLRV